MTSWSTPSTPWASTSRVRASSRRARCTPARRAALARSIRLAAALMRHAVGKRASRSTMKAFSCASISGGRPTSSNSAWLDRARSYRADAVSGTPDSRAIWIESRNTWNRPMTRSRSAAADSAAADSTAADSAAAAFTAADSTSAASLDGSPPTGVGAAMPGLAAG